MKKLVNIIETISMRTGKLFSWLIFLVIASVVMEIIMRYVFKNPTEWAIEVTLFSCTLMYVFGSAWTLEQGKHVKIDILYGHLDERKRAILDCFTFVFFLIFMVAFIWAGFRFAGKSIVLWEHSGSSWDPPIWPIKLAVPVASLLLFFQGIAKFIKDLHLAVKGRAL